jgi:hypothetical protein
MMPGGIRTSSTTTNITTEERKMTGMVSPMTELIDAELDAVAAGSNQGQNGTGLVVVGAQIGDISVTAVDILSHNAVLNNSLNGVTVQVPIGVAVAVLSGATGVAQHLGL